MRACQIARVEWHPCSTFHSFFLLTSPR